MRRTAVFIAALVLSSATALACIWDNDTLKTELKGLPDVPRVIAGTFDRYPPLYFEMRLERAAKAVEATPDALAEYDNAGAACDRLGRGDEAVRWMERKQERIDVLAQRTGDDAVPGLDDQRYRQLANVGTFIAHRWLRAGAPRDRIGEMKQAAAKIRAAIELNPDAHFGREKYQLMAMDWLIAGKTLAKPQPGLRAGLADFLGLRDSRFLHEISDNTHLKDLGMPDAIQGLAGMIVLGNAWESVDMFNALSVALSVDGRSKVAYLAHLRARQLVRAGKRSLQPGTPTDAKQLEQLLHAPMTIDDEAKRELEATFKRARKRAKEWLATRNAKILARLKTGRHPDTDPTFFDEL